MAMIDRDDQKRQIQEQTDIVALIGEQVRLHPKGKELVCLCPFHEDRNPSMYVSSVKQIYKCFVCGSGGDVFSFVMNYHKIGFVEALEMLANRAGIELVRSAKIGQEAGQQSQNQSDRKILSQANSLAIDFFQACFKHTQTGKVAQDYLQKRDISNEMVQAFQIGYAPDGWDHLTKTILKKNWPLKGFELAGLVSPRKQGDGDYDKLRHRLIFPICDSIGRPIAFGGRRIREEDEPKYLNSPETLLFNKSATLYGLHLAKQTILQAKTAVVVEGYTDVVACHQAGVTNVVATLGTALTAQHVRALRHLAERVVLVFDADVAGQRAADRAIEVFISGELDVAIAVIPQGKDPAELFAQADGMAVWTQIIKDATDALTYQFERMKQTFQGANSVVGQQRIAEDYLRTLAGFGLQKMPMIRQALVIQKLVELLHLPEQTIHEMIRRLQPASVAKRQQNNRVTGSNSTFTRQPATRQGPSSNANSKGDFVDNQGADPNDIQSYSSSDPQSGGQYDDAKNNAVFDGGDFSFDASNESYADAPTSAGLRLAEMLLIGGLVHAPQLFHLDVQGGRTLDEAITPMEITSGPLRAIYKDLYAQLADGARVTLGTLLADFASQNKQELANLLTEIEIEIDKILAVSDLSEEECFQKVINKVSYAILTNYDEIAYRQLKATMLSDKASEAGSREKMMTELLEYRKSHTSPLRIARSRDK